MKIIKATAEPITETDPYKKIEKIGRTCYKSEDKITDDSCYKFVDTLIKHQHFAMLEHAVAHFFVEAPVYTHLTDDFNTIERARITDIDIGDFGLYGSTYVVTLSLSHLYNPRWNSFTFMKSFKDCFETKEAVTYLNSWKISLISDSKMKSIFKDNCLNKEDMINCINYHTLWSCKFICDRGVSHEIVRHRRSFAQESTRYCNYTQGKFGGELTFVEPSTWDNWSEDAKEVYLNELTQLEDTYFKLSAEGLQPQQARAILPNSLKTEVIMSAYVDEWEHFFDVRSRGTTGAPHPDMKYVADIAVELFNSRK